MLVLRCGEELPAGDAVGRYHTRPDTGLARIGDGAPALRPLAPNDPLCHAFPENGNKSTANLPSSDTKILESDETGRWEPF